MSTSVNCRRDFGRCIFGVIFALMLGAAHGTALGAQYQWDFSGNVNATFGNGALTYADASSQTLTTFGTTNGTTVPHINGQPATYMHVPAFTALTEGYNAEFSDTVPNGGGAYVNQYTMVFDVLVPGPLNWTPFFNTNPNNPATNDADFYLAYDGAIGIGSDYSDINIVAPDTWNRIAFTADLAIDQFTYYLNGVQVFQHNGPAPNPLLDDRFALESNVDAGPDLRLFNEGDTSGDYTHELYWSSFFFADHTLLAADIASLGGPDADGIGLAGDYNHSGTVDGADYVIWRKAGGPATDYDVWRSNYGRSPANGAGAGLGASAQVPEPASVAMILLALPAFLAVARRR